VTTNDNTHLLDPWDTWADAVSAVGYHTGMFGKYENLHPWGDHGFDNLHQASGWREWCEHIIASGQYLNYRLHENGVVIDKGSTDADYVTDVLSGKVVDFISRAKEPFAAYLAHWAPHEATVAATRHTGLYSGVDWTTPPNFNEADISDKPTWLRNTWPTQRTPTKVADFKADRVNTWRTLRAVDESIEDIIDALKARGILDNTVLIFLSDNGVMFGEHRVESKGVPYEENVCVDMMVRWPGATQRVDHALVQNFDIAPTICDIAGTVMPYAPDGMSFRPVVEETIASEDFRSAQLIEWFSSTELPEAAWRCLRTATAKYVHHFGGDKEFYDLVVDPYEMTNIAGTGDPRQAQMAADLAAIEVGPYKPVLA
jgi:arylsulfatase A-like enzyme